ncbi:hypothetical protein G6F59_013504 [Rhizopus arrhizus]|nr:hypothetical protein G6F59_013504 [Rhizopus arrhizus]
MRRRPLGRPRATSASCSAPSTSSRITRARARKAWPKSVRLCLRVVRLSRRTPRCCSSAWMCLPTSCGDRSSTAAAAAKEPTSATLAKVRRGTISGHHFPGGPTAGPSLEPPMSQVVRIHEYGNADVLRIDDIDVPAPAADEIQVRVKAIGLNRAEVIFRNGAYLQQAQFPSRLGYEAAGVVEAIGSAVDGFSAGDAVSVVPPLDIARWGTYGELANVPARLVVKHPASLGFEQAAAVWMQYVTAWGALLEHAKLGAGEFVIITAASSSVGLAAIQIANAVGATPIARASPRAPVPAWCSIRSVARSSCR